SCNTGVPVYRTAIACAPAGPFAGPLVVSMRPFKPADAIRAVQITSRFPSVHGAPVHIGLPEAIGIRDIGRPDYGDPVEVKADELPVFWACGVTPQAVIAASRPEFAITHVPGDMLVTDLRNSRLAAL
ncbi:MAG: D-glutamate cyclase family protein, partial [Phreatobacter sp.]